MTWVSERAGSRYTNLSTRSTGRRPGNPARARQRHARHRRRLDGERYHVLGLEVVEVGLSARTREGLGLERHRAQVVGEAAAAELGVETRGELVLLRRDARRILALVPVVVEACGRAEVGVAVLQLGRVVAEGDQRGDADRDRVGAEGECLRHIGAVADTP